jgi:DNA modification methylase
MEKRKVSEIIFREDLYPRINADPETIQKYAENIDVMPPIEVNQHNELIDGFHRWTAHRKVEREDIVVTVTQTKSDAELLRMAIRLNAKHGLQLSIDDKSERAKLMYDPDAKNGDPGGVDDLATLLSVTPKTIKRYVSAIDKANRKKKNRIIRDMWLSCRTEEEISKVVGYVQSAIAKKIKDLSLLDTWEKVINLSAQYYEKEWTPENYDIWNFDKNANHKHYGNTHVGIVDNLLYLFTEPFDIVIDPFAGGGSTIDICKKRLRRYWVSDRKPIVERENDIRQHDVVTDGITGPYHWSDVALVYLDPPYWKQAAGKYSEDPTDLANMTLQDFTEAMANIIDDYGRKLKAGAHIACIISPTQWPNEDKTTNYHDIDFITSVGSHLKLKRHIICPYSTEQYNGTQVNIAKDKKLNLVISRRLIVWEVTK